MTFEGHTDSTEHRSRLSQWLDWWFEQRLRALITWTVLAFVSGLLFDNHWVQQKFFASCAFVTDTLERYIGFSPSLGTVDTVSMLALFSWFQPLALRIGLLRGVAWIVVQCFLATAMLFTFRDIGVLFAYSDFSGIPGLLAIGVRTRPWMSLVGGLASTTLYFLINVVGNRGLLEHFKYYVLVSNVPYAIVMLYGTKLISRRGHEG